MATSNQSVRGQPSTPLTLAILGCGSLGTAILCGVLASLEDHKAKKDDGLASQINTPIPSNFIACVRTAASATRISTALGPLPPNVTIQHGHDSAPSLHDADVIVLGCQPTDLHTCLSNGAIRAALHGKLLISLLAGVTTSDIDCILHDEGDRAHAPTTIVRAMPNTASVIRESMTVIEAPVGTTAEKLQVVDWLFGSIGTVQHISASKFDTCTALCASTPAFFALFLEGLIDGAVALGLSRSETQVMAAQAMKGTAALVLAGEHPAQVKETITTPGGSTIRGVLKLEQGMLRAVAAGALIECKIAAESLGVMERK